MKAEFSRISRIPLEDTEITDMMILLKKGAANVPQGTKKAWRQTSKE
jgi:hypothetical protein